MHSQERKLSAHLSQRDAAAPPVVRFGSPLYRYDQVTSTQDVAREHAERLPVPGLTVTARQMTAGRGRLGRGWEHAPGANVALTIIAPPVLPGDAWQVAITASLAVCAAAQSVAPGIEARIRFPNDIYVDGRKLAGVLVETIPFTVEGKVLSRGRERVPLVGIGVNVQKVSLSPDIAGRAVSLEEASGSAVQVQDVEAALFQWLTVYWDEWRQSGFAALLPTWHEKLDTDARRAFVLNGENHWCRVRALSLDGQVTLEADEGNCHLIHVAHVLFGEDDQR